MAVYNCIKCIKAFKIKDVNKKEDGFSFQCPHCKTKHRLISGLFGSKKIE